MAERSQGLWRPGTPQRKCSVLALVDASLHQVLGMQRGAKRMDTLVLWSVPILGEADSKQVKKISGRWGGRTKAGRRAVGGGADTWG